MNEAESAVRAAGSSFLTPHTFLCGSPGCTTSTNTTVVITVGLSCLIWLQARYKLQPGDSVVFGKLPDGTLLVCGQHSIADRTGLPTVKSASKPKPSLPPSKPASALSNGLQGRKKRMRSLSSTPAGTAQPLKLPRVSHCALAHGIIPDSDSFWTGRLEPKLLSDDVSSNFSSLRDADSCFSNCCGYSKQSHDKQYAGADKTGQAG